MNWFPFVLSVPKRSTLNHTIPLIYSARLDKRGNDILSALESHREKQAGICPSKPRKHHEKQIERIIIEVVVISITLETTIVQVLTKTETLTKTKKSIHSASTRRSTVKSNHTPKKHKTVRTQIPTSRRPTSSNLSRPISPNIPSLSLTVASVTSLTSVLYFTGPSVISSLSPSISPSTPSQPFCYRGTLCDPNPPIVIEKRLYGVEQPNTDLPLSTLCSNICASLPGCILFVLFMEEHEGGYACFL